MCKVLERSFVPLYTYNRTNTGEMTAGGRDTTRLHSVKTKAQTLNTET
jgi:hypothetical protein